MLEAQRQLDRYHEQGNNGSSFGGVGDGNSVGSRMPKHTNRQRFVSESPAVAQIHAAVAVPTPSSLPSGRSIVTSSKQRSLSWLDVQPRRVATERLPWISPPLHHRDGTEMDDDSCGGCGGDGGDDEENAAMTLKSAWNSRHERLIHPAVEQLES